MIAFNMDVHMHFDLYKNKQDILNYIEENKSYTITVTNLPDLYKRYYDERLNYKNVRLALRFHPELAEQYYNQIEIFKELFVTTRFIGKFGLDYSTKSAKNQKKQKDIFKQIVDLCKKDRNKIISVHTRKIVGDCLRILDGFERKVILHWYTGNLENLRIALTRGYFFFINQQMITSKKRKKIINAIPVDRIVIERDAPFTVGINSSYNFSFVSDIIGYLFNKQKKLMKNHFMYR